MRKLVLSFAAGVLLAIPAFGDITSIVTYPSGNNGDVQFNQNKRFAADTGNLTYSTSTKALTVNGIVTSTVTINGITYYFPASECPGGTFFRYDGSGVVTCANPSTFNVSTGIALGVWDGGVNISTVTSDIKFDPNQFIITLLGNTTASVALNPSSVTVMGVLTAASPVTLTGSQFGLDKSSVTLRGPDPALGGDLSGTISNAVVADDSHNHTSSSISGLDISADTNLSAIQPVLLVGDAVSIDMSSVTLLGPSIDAAELPANGYASTYVNETGDTMTGQLTISGSSLTVTGARGVSVRYGVSAGSVSVTDDAYDATSWNGNTQVPTKNAVRDKFESFSVGSLPPIAFSTGTSAGFTGVPITSPTVAVVFDSRTTTGQAIGPSTYFFLLNPSSVTLQGQNVIFNTSSLQAGTTAYPFNLHVGNSATIDNDLAVGDDVTVTGGMTIDGSAGLTLSALDPDECVGTNSSGKLVTTGSPCGSGGGGPGMSPGATYYIQVTDTLQSGATFYVSSGTVKGPFTIRSRDSFGFGSSSNSINFFASDNGFQDSEINIDGPGRNFDLSVSSSNGFGKLALSMYGGTYNATCSGALIWGGICLSYDDKKIIFYQRNLGFNYISLRASQTVTTTEYVWPNADGTSGQALTTDGSGNMSWSSVSGGAPSNSILLKDSDGVLWAVGLQTTGNLVTTSLGPQSYDPDPLQIVDSGSNVWNLTVTTTGALETEPVP